METWSFGDSWNDIPMHEAADHAVALPWSSAEVTAVCERTMGSIANLVDYTIGTREADGVNGPAIRASGATDNKKD